jgi:osmotically-inducible protein OsmY
MRQSSRDGGSWRDQADGEYDDTARETPNDDERNGRQPRGRFAGRGPKGYKRSDARICEDVSDRFTDDEWLDASDIAVQVRDGEVILSGTVTDRSQKRRAEDLACRVSGVHDVSNGLRVTRGQDAERSDSPTDKPSPSMFRTPATTRS